MRKYILTIAIALAALSLTLPPALAEMVNGQVVKVDEAAGKITIKHGAIKKFDVDDGIDHGVGRAGSGDAQAGQTRRQDQVRG